MKKQHNKRYSGHKAVHHAVFSLQLLDEIKSKLLREDPDYRLLVEKRIFLRASLTAIRESILNSKEDCIIHAEQYQFIIDLVDVEKRILEKERHAIYLQGYLDHHGHPVLESDNRTGDDEPTFDNQEK